MLGGRVTVLYSMLCVLLFFNFGFGQTIYTGVSSGPGQYAECLPHLNYSPTTHCSVRNAKVRIEIGASDDKIYVKNKDDDVAKL